MTVESHRRRIGTPIHQHGYQGQLGSDEILRPIGGLVARGEVHVMIFHFPAQAGKDTADWSAPSCQPDRGSVPQLARVLPDRSQTFLNGTIQVSADCSCRSARASLDGFGAGLLRRVLLADTASPGSPQQPGARVGGVRDMGEYMRPRLARQR